MSLTRRRIEIGFAALVVAALVAGSSSSATHSAHAGVDRLKRSRSAVTRVIGYSVQHRPIVATLLASGRAARSMLVVGSIAGDEPGGTAVANALASLLPVKGVRLWLLPDMNPDGAARGTRGNADGVDLNRNFPFRWSRFAGPGSRYYPGSRPASEPESRAVAAFISRLRPGLTVGSHEPYALIDDSQGPRWVEQFLSRKTGLPLQRLVDYPGSAIGWEDHLIPAGLDAAVEFAVSVATEYNRLASERRAGLAAVARRRLALEVELRMNAVSPSSET